MIKHTHIYIYTYTQFNKNVYLINCYYFSGLKTILLNGNTKVIFHFRWVFKICKYNNKLDFSNGYIPTRIYTNILLETKLFK